jgi:hypothetical protein
MRHEAGALFVQTPEIERQHPEQKRLKVCFTVWIRDCKPRKMIPELPSGRAPLMPDETAQQSAPADVYRHRAVAEHVDSREGTVLLLLLPKVLDVVTVSRP